MGLSYLLPGKWGGAVSGSKPGWQCGLSLLASSYNKKAHHSGVKEVQELKRCKKRM